MAIESKIFKTWEHTGWGNSIQWLGDSRIYGFLRNIPKKGDEIQSKMQSGKIGRYAVIAVDVKHDPADMFFADVKFMNYLKATPTY